MAIRYRHHPPESAEAPTRPREGEVADLGELEALARLGSLAPGDEVSLDGRRYVSARQVPELKDVFRDRGSRDGNPVVTVALGAVAVVVGMAALGAVMSVASLVVKVGLLVAAVAAGVWVFRRFKR